jgi:hypothetical protein
MLPAPLDCGKMVIIPGKHSRNAMRLANSNLPARPHERSALTVRDSVAQA